MHALDIPVFNTLAGISVCIIDSGYDLGHEDLQTTNVDGVSRMCNTFEFFRYCDWDVDISGHG